MIFLNIRQKHWLKILIKAKKVPSNIDEINFHAGQQCDVNETVLLLNIKLMLFYVARARVCAQS